MAYTKGPVGSNKTTGRFVADPIIPVVHEVLFDGRLSGYKIAEAYGPRAMELAQLIAAAPELLEALKLAEAALYEAVEIAPLYRLPTKVGNALQLIGYVIAKAEGRNE